MGSKTVASANVAVEVRREKVDHGPSVARNLSTADSPCLCFKESSTNPTFITVPVGMVLSKSASSWLWDSLSVLGISIRVSPSLSLMSNRKADGPSPGLLGSWDILAFWLLLRSVLGNEVIITGTRDLTLEICWRRCL